MLLFFGAVCVSLVLHIVFGKWGTKSNTKPFAEPKAPVRGAWSPEHAMAIHEAGHAVVCWFCTMVTHISKATIEGPTGGVVSFDVESWKAVECDWCRLVIALGGIAAEAFYSLRVHGPSVEQDLQTALTYAQRIVDRNDEFSHGSSPWPVVPGPSFPFERMFDSIEKKYSDAMRAGYAVARRMVIAHHDAHDKVTGLLLGRRTVDHRELEQALGPRVAIEFLHVGSKCGIWKPTFVLPEGVGWA